MPTRVIDRNYSANDSSSTLLGYQKSKTEEGEVVASKSVVDGTTDMEVTFAVPYAQIKAILIGSDQDITVEVNHPGGSSTAADQTFTILANQPLLWLFGDPVANPIEQDITKLYVTNASGETAQFEARALLDATPLV